VRLDALFAGLMLAWNKLGVHLLEATNLAQVFVIELLLVEGLSTEDQWRSFVVPLLDLTFGSLSDENLQLMEHLLIPLHEA
jgi:hypothetical protein